ncbi:MAG: hypothetical protein C0506_17180 [Anaerolinea sp.]|nr:hypothetical protein [Anaerolinea sp.]
MGIRPKAAQKKPARKAAAKPEQAQRTPAVKSPGATRKERAAAIAAGAVQVAAKAERRELIQALIKMAMKKLEKGPEKATVTDLIRLLSLEKEIGEEGPSKIVVEWIDPRTGEPWKPTE